MANKSYSQKLKDPRWQKKRLEILSRANWTCERCEAQDKTLHVHHSFYEFERDPWDYPSFSLKVLCEECHEYAEWLRAWLKKYLFSEHLDVQHAVYSMMMALEAYGDSEKKNATICITELITSVVNGDREVALLAMEKLLSVPRMTEESE